jgi:hypothetical protein
MTRSGPVPNRLPLEILVKDTISDRKNIAGWNSQEMLAFPIYF